MIDDIVRAWNTVQALGTGGQIASWLIVAHIIVIAGFMALAGIRFYSSISMKPPSPIEAKDASHLAEWRDRVSNYINDLDKGANKLRSEALTLFKDSSDWGRLGIQYSLIVNAGALAALPYLIDSSRHAVQITAASAAAGWFATGLILAADCCLAAYINLQAMGEAFFADRDIEIAVAIERHFADDSQRGKAAKAAARANFCRKITVTTVSAAVVLALASWVSFMWGTINLISHVVTPLTRAAGISL